MIYAATGEERIWNGCLPCDASGHQQAVKIVVNGSGLMVTKD